MAKEDANKSSENNEQVNSVGIEFIANFPVENLVPRARKTRFRSKESKKVLQEMLHRFGWVQPIIVDRDFKIVDGQYRYELAKSMRVKTVPVVVANTLNSSDGTTDLYHMLANRIVEWDKWNFPETDAILKELDGGLTTEVVLDYEVPSEKGYWRDLAKTLGWFIRIVPSELSTSKVNFETLGELLTKQLGSKYQFDPAQLLFIEALRKEVVAIREQMIAEGETSGGIVAKQARLDSEEKVAMEKGAKVVADSPELLKITDDNISAFVPIKEIEFVISKLKAKQEQEMPVIETAKDFSKIFKESGDKKKLGVNQFKILATYFADMTLDEAEHFFNSSSPADLNAFVDKILDEGRVLPPDRSKNFPVTEEEIAKSLREAQAVTESIRESRKKRVKVTLTGYEAATMNQLRPLAKAHGIKFSGLRREDLVQSLKQHGVPEPDATREIYVTMVGNSVVNDEVATKVSNESVASGDEPDVNSYSKLKSKKKSKKSKKHKK